MRSSKTASEPLAGVSSAELVMGRESRVGYGRVPHGLIGSPLAEMSWQMLDDRFLLRGTGDHYFFYRKGAGITVERGPGAELAEEALWLNGSVYAAIASMNGLLPVHASAVACRDMVFAFTGGAGAGKSTLVAGLANRGMPMFCDDTLVLDISDPGTITCLPGHKRLKLRSDAIALTGAAQQEKVSTTVEKFYARPVAGEVHHSLPLGELIFLEEASDPRIAPITGAERFSRLDDEHPTALLFAGARRFDRPAEFAHRARLARQIRMASFGRPRVSSRFDEGVRMIADYIRNARRAGQ